MSGDARRALEICRRAAEFADYRIKQSQQSGQTSANKGTGTYVWGSSHQKCLHCIFSLFMIT